MSELSKNYKKIMSELEKNISDPQELEYVKKQVNKLSISFLEQMDKLIQDNEEKIESIILNQNDLNKKILKMEKQLEEIESDIYMDESTEVNVSCPYCNYQFTVDVDESDSEIICPECNNIIELDWNDGCSGNCSDCDNKK